MNNTREALQIWAALKPMIMKTIDERTKPCIRATKMRVTSAPSNNLLGVTKPFDEKEILIPYSSSLATVQVGDAVWVWYFFNDASTMIAMQRGNGQFT